MAMEQARAYLKQYHKEQDILVLDASSATVEQAAQALGTQPERIAKSLSFMVREHAVIVVAAGDCRVDNHACGTPNSAIRLTIAELETLLPQASWVDVCRVA